MDFLIDLSRISLFALVGIWFLGLFAYMALIFWTVFRRIFGHQRDKRSAYVMGHAQILHSHLTAIWKLAFLSVVVMLVLALIREVRMGSVHSTPDKSAIRDHK
jgi:hypothetical protein